MDYGCEGYQVDFENYEADHNIRYIELIEVSSCLEVTTTPFLLVYFANNPAVGLVSLDATSIQSTRPFLCLLIGL